MLDIQLFHKFIYLSTFSAHPCVLSGYADRIHELMAISRELSLVNEKSSLQRVGSRNCSSEANYIEFSGVKASKIC